MKSITERITPKQYILNFLLICSLLLSLYLLVAWSTYSPLDSSWSTSTSWTQTSNKTGEFGAWLMDLLFVLFGYVSNFIPFSALALSLYLLFRKKKKQFSYWRMLRQILGLILFLSGTCVLLNMLFTHNVSYPSGGVLGALLAQFLFPVLDVVGLMLISAISSIAGFLLFTGMEFIYLMVDFFAWLNMQKKAEENTQSQTESPTEQLAFTDETLDGETNQALTLETEVAPSQQNPNQCSDHDLKEQSSLVNIEKFINIQGLEANENSEQPNTLIHRDSALNLPNFDVEIENSDPIELPRVQVVNGYEQNPVQNSNISLMDVQDISRNVENAQNILVPYDTGITNSPLNTEAESTVSLAFSQSDLSAVEYQVSDKEEDNSAENRVIETVEENNQYKQDMVYKSYQDTLIHPALQPKATHVEKPTTPLPSLDLLEHRPAQANRITKEEIEETSQRIEQQLRNFNVKAEVKDVLVGPVVTRYELELQPGVKASRVTSIDTDLARALMFRSIRVAEVIPDKPYIGIETPNVHRQTVSLREVLDSDAFRQTKALLPMALGKDISGQAIVVDLAKMPHLLVAGSTGSGKSVGINTMILSLLYRVKPEDVKFIMIDPKVVELSIYDGIPHLLTNVVTDMKKAANALRWCVDEMERRYQLLSALRVRNIEGYNEKIAEYEALNMPIPNPLWRPGDTLDQMPPPLEKLNYIVVIVDEFADLMMVAGKQVEELIARLAQKARAIGIHLILATQRPSVDVITGLIKANIPSRIAFTVASKIDSRTILDQGGAEALLGRGDMLYSPQGSTELMRVHGAFMSDDEVARVVDDWKARGKPTYIDGIQDSPDDEAEEDSLSADSSDELDALFDEVVDFVISTGNTSTSYIQRKFKVGFNRAARIMDQLEEQGIIAVHNGKREVVGRRTSDY
ncbi:DNA translocase FtsK [[Haemophilus] felis]|uniref:DNA translocase FtsK n=1 Tax=[Haemophilus] felis TaxID=123822 RepID=A0A1T0BB97_9PAST|nr:DNA translocase FtsK [[Haemophilus] felis]NBI40316.1 DNA translocase FtsK [[Haemophilus] felis]OOS07051.1 cell division protein FtsK [[Haemophilus] felis]